MPIINHHLKAHHAQPFSGRHAGRAGADNADALRPFAHGLGRLHPAILPRRIGDVFFDSANGDRLKTLFDHAIAFAKPILRANAAANLREVIGGGRDLIGFFKPAFGGQLQPIRDVVV